MVLLSLTLTKWGCDNINIWVRAFHGIVGFFTIKQILSCQELRGIIHFLFFGWVLAESMVEAE
jgi:hypothetical protein